MHTTRLHITLIALLFSLLRLTATPKLTVVVLIDGLSESSLNLMQPYWAMGGLRTLSEEAYQGTVLFPGISYGGAENIATLMTGEIPAVHGITMGHYFSRNDRSLHSALEDKSEAGIGTMEQVSPRALTSLTIADRFRLKEGKKARIYAIGHDAETAILMAGHTADACCWLNPQSEQWVTSSFYANGLPTVADEINVSGRISELSAQSWTPRMAVNMYNCPTEQELKHGFKYTQSNVLLHSPAVNTLTAELALELQRKEELGKQQHSDLLLLQLTSLTPAATSDHIATAEQEDQYMCLNQTLGWMLEQLQRRLGKGNVQFFVIGIPRLGTAKQQFGEIGIPIRQFNVERAAALTSAYLMALYGQERWVDGGYGQSIFLNRNLIEQKRMSLETLQRQVSNFLIDFEGVQTAYPMQEAWLDRQLAPVLSKKAAGDVVFLLQQGWQLTYGEQVLDPLVDLHPAAPILIWPSTDNLPTATLNAEQVANLLETIDNR